MKTRNPLLGLLTFSFHDMGGNVLRALPLPLLVGVAAKIVGAEMLLLIFPFMAFTNAPYVVMMKSETVPIWDRYQLAMPLKRKDVAAVLYLNVFLASLLAIPIIAIVWAVGYVAHGSTLAAVFNGTFSLGAVMYGSVLLSAALLYPIGSSRFGQRNTQSVFFGSLVLAFAFGFGMLWAGNAMGLSEAAVSLLIIGLSGIAFIISLFITKAMFEKMEF